MISVYRLTICGHGFGEPTYVFDYLTLDAAIVDMKEAKAKGRKISLVEASRPPQ